MTLTEALGIWNEHYVDRYLGPAVAHVALCKCGHRGPYRDHVAHRLERILAACGGLRCAGREALRNQPEKQCVSRPAQPGHDIRLP